MFNPCTAHHCNPYLQCFLAPVKGPSYLVGQSLRSRATATIAKAITAGGSNREVAVRFKLTESSVQRDRVNCLRARRRGRESGTPEGHITASGSVRFESSRGEITSPRDLLSRLSTLFRLGDLLEEAYEKRDIDACVKLAREYRAAAESYAKVAGWLVDGASNTTIDARKQTFQVLANFSEA